MTDRMSREDAARRRSAGMVQRGDRPRQRRAAESPASGLPRVSMRAQTEIRDSADGSALHFHGLASRTEYAYEVWDWFGPYTEIIDAAAFDDTLARDDLDVPLVLGHDSLRRIARTTNGSLTLAATEDGLEVDAPALDPGDADVAYIVPKVRGGLIDEMSFAFRIDSGQWSPDYTEYRVMRLDLHRGDVSIVGYGANDGTDASIIESPARSDAGAGQARDVSSAAPAALGDQPAELTAPTIREESTIMADSSTTTELAAETVELPAQTRGVDVEAFEARVAQLEQQLRARDNVLAAEQRAGTPAPAYDQTVRVVAEARTYHRGQDPRGRGRDFLTDVAAEFRGSSAARQRLERHMAEERVERGAQIERATTTAAYTGWVVPQYLIELNAAAAVAGRRFADVCNHHDLPETGMTCYLSKITTGSSVDDQSSENATVSETDMDDTQISIGVRTAAGSQTVSRQALERGAGVDDITFADLLKRYNKNLDTKVISATTSGLTNVATSVAYTDASPTAAELYPKIQAAASGAESVFLDVVDGLVVVMHPRRWRWLSAAMTSTWPFVAGDRVPAQAAAVTEGNLSESATIRGYLPDGTPVVTDANIATNLGAGTNEDEIYVVAPEECHLWEDPSAPMLIRAETNPKKLQLDLVLYGYYAFYLDRYAGGHQKIAGTGLTTPTFA